MSKQNMYNEYEAITPQAQEDFKDIESHINDCVRSMANKYNTINIEHYLHQLVANTCAVTRFGNAMDMRITKRTKCYVCSLCDSPCKVEVMEPAKKPTQCLEHREHCNWKGCDNE